MVYEKPDFDSVLLGKGGPEFWGFGKQAQVGQYIEGYLVKKDSRHKQKFQTKQQRDAGSPVEYEYFKGKGKVSSSDAPEDYMARNSECRPIWELVTILQTQLVNPEKENDNGHRTFAWPWRAQQELAEVTRRQGIEGGLPVGTFIRVTLKALVPVEGLDTPKREYKVEIWAPGEQPSSSPAAPAPVQAAPAPQQFAAPVAQPQFAFAPAPVAAVAVAPAAPQFQAYPPEMLQMMKEQGLPHPLGLPWE